MEEERAMRLVRPRNGHRRGAGAQPRGPWQAPSVTPPTAPVLASGWLRRRCRWRLLLFGGRQRRPVRANRVRRATKRPTLLCGPLVSSYKRTRLLEAANIEFALLVAASRARVVVVEL
jgi:hypothetical protein